MAHPDDEYTFAATVYRLAQELEATVDQLVISNAESGYRYSQLAELTREDAGRRKLPAIRRQETLNAGRVLGIRHHWFSTRKTRGTPWTRRRQWAPGTDD